MKQLLSILCFMMCTVLSVNATDNSKQLWNKANAAYKQKNYEEAISYYQQIIVQQPQNATALYNLGNAFYKSNKVSDAVLQYERALFYEPQNQKAKDNLTLAKNRIPNAIKQNSDIFFMRWWTTATAGNYATMWAMISLFLFIALLGITLLSIIKKNTNPFPIQVFIFTPLFILLFLFCAFTAANNATHSNKAVIMHHAATMTTAPNEHKGQILIPEATTVEIGEIKGIWIAITLPDNRTGWIQKAELTFVQPSNKK